MSNENRLWEKRGCWNHCRSQLRIAEKRVRVMKWTACCERAGLNVDWPIRIEQTDKGRDHKMECLFIYLFMSFAGNHLWKSILQVLKASLYLYLSPFVFPLPMNNHTSNLSGSKGMTEFCQFEYISKSTATHFDRNRCNWWTRNGIAIAKYTKWPKLGSAPIYKFTQLHFRSIKSTAETPTTV